MPDAALHSTDLIIGRGLLTAETIADELRRRLVHELARRGPLASHGELLELARRILREFEPLLAENLATTDLAAWVAGLDRVVDRLPAWAEDLVALDRFGAAPPPRPPRGFLAGAFDDGDNEPIIEFPQLEEAASSLFERRIVRREEFDRLADQERRRAFTVAGEHTEDTLETIRDTLAQDIAEGTSLRGFRQKLREQIDTSSIGPAHLENIYRTNVQAAFSEGRERIMADPIVSEVFPYQAYIAIHDGRVRDDHLDLETLGIDGTNIFRRDDPFWDFFTPPFDFNCRCGVNPMTIEAAARKGVREARQWLDTGVKPPLDSRLPDIPFRPPAGFVGGRRVAA